MTFHPPIGIIGPLMMGGPNYLDDSPVGWVMAGGVKEFIELGFVE